MTRKPRTHRIGFFPGLISGYAVFELSHTHWLIGGLFTGIAALLILGDWHFGKPRRETFQCQTHPEDVISYGPSTTEEFADELGLNKEKETEDDN
jgi:hypothetical protein